MAAVTATRENRVVRRFCIPAIVALMLAPAAAAHVTITPTRTAPGSDVLVTFVVPNEAESPIGRVIVHLPGSFSSEGVSGPPGWHLARRAGSLVWSGGPILPGRFVTFGLTGSAPSRSGDVVFRVDEVLAGGRTESYRPRLLVGSPPAVSTKDHSAHTLGKAALFVAIAAGAVAVGAFFLALAQWLRGGAEELQES
jgi:uncharacterized protein YcnI